MLNKTIHDELLDRGIATVDFPEGLKAQIEFEILNVLGSLHNAPPFNTFEEAQAFILTLDDQEFRRTLTKPKRTLQQKVSKLVLEWVVNNFTGFFQYKSVHISSIPDWEAEQIEHLSNEQVSIYWRCVRPNKENDVAGAHQDSTFWRIASKLDYNPICPFEYKQRWKVWLPLFGCETDNALQLLPYSHKMQVPDRIIDSDIGERPIIEPDWLHRTQSQFISPVNSHDGQCVIFHDDIVHKGPVNRSSNTRFSVEWTILTG